MPTRWRRHGWCLAFFAGYAAFLVSTLSQYGVTWDVFFEFPRATAYVSRFLPGSAESGISPWHTMSWETAASTSKSANGVLPSLVAATTGKVFFEWLGLLDYIDAYHLGLVLIWLLAVVHFYLRLQALHDPSLALLAVILLCLSPRVVGNVQNNMKDIPAMAFATAALLEVAVATARRRAGLIAGAGTLFGCAIASKFTAAIAGVPAAVLLWMGFRGTRMPPHLPRGFWIALLSVPAVVLVVLFGHWPYLWAWPPLLWERLAVVQREVALHEGSGTPSIYPVAMTLMTTPVPVLAGLALAMALSLNRRARTSMPAALRRLYWTWLLTVLVAFSSGHIMLFDGVRQFILVWPPMAVLAAWGILHTLRAAAARWGRIAVVGAGVPALVVASCITSLALYHPYEITYFNVLAGGLRGATRVTFGASVFDYQPRDYWGTSLRRTIRWANENLPQGATVAFGVPLGLYRAYRLRPDLVVSGDQQPAARAHYVIFLVRPNWYTDLEIDALIRGDLVHSEGARGVQLSVVYRLPD